VKDIKFENLKLQLIELLRQRSRPYLFSNALAPSMVGIAAKAFELVSQPGNSLTKQLKSNVALFRKEMKRLGFTLLGHDQVPICPVFFGDAKVAGEFAEGMLDEGIYVRSFAYPVVPKEKARIRVQVGGGAVVVLNWHAWERFQISAAHSKEQIERCLGAFEKIGEKIRVLLGPPSPAPPAPNSGSTES